MNPRTAFVLAAAAAGIVGSGALAVQPGISHMTSPKQRPVARRTAFLAPGLVMPAMDAERGKHLFAEKGCVVCHSINGVGGTDAPKLDAATMPPHMNPFDFFAKMWRGAVPMIMMQHDEIGHQIEFTGQDLADIVAFVHNPEVQKSFTEDDIPHDIQDMMEEDEDGEGHSDGSGMGSELMGGSGMMGGSGTGKSSQ